jgi:DNA-3-methyladenine glycosylase I
MITRCKWAEGHELLKDYHDCEWGIPVKDDQKLFEYLTLEGAQAGLSWLTILKKREYYQQAFYHFEIERIAEMSIDDLEELYTNQNLIKNKLKLKSVIHNAKCVATIQKEYNSFSEFIWSFVDHKPICNQWKSDKYVPSKSEISEKMSKALKSYGFKFVGPTICYSFMQAAGLVDDHIIDCVRFHKRLITKDYLDHKK